MQQSSFSSSSRWLCALLGLAALAASGTALAARDVVLAIGYQPETLDPYNTNSTITTAVTKSFYEGLFQFDKDLKIRNVLAESHDMSKDGLVYTFRLRTGVKFHDGTDFDAHAVKATLDRVLNRENKLLRHNQFNRMARVEVLNADTVRITLKEPFGPFINSLAHASAAMISPAALKKWGNKDIAFHPVGTGPFEFVEWKQTDAVKAKKFDGYWKKGYPKIDTLAWKPVPENNTRAAMLQTGEADFAFPIPYEQAQLLKASNKLEVVASPSIMMRFLAFNMLHKPYDNPKVREAIGYAINKEALAKVAFGGYAFPAQGVLPQGVQFAEKMAPIPYDVKKARELLKEGGYPDGFESVLWSSSNNTSSQKVLQFVQQQLAQVGIRLQVQALEVGQRAEMVDAWPDPKTAKVRMYYSGWSSSTGEADWGLRPLFASESWAPKLNNMSFYKSEVVDQALAKALTTVDAKEKAALYKIAQDEIRKDLPRVPLLTDQNLSAHSKRLSGVHVMPDANINIDAIAVAH
ncbi:glutathione ABC transporter substrate-binding protein GsiB [Verminephrobacter aporrectodeae subsp. tuberculatae]|uniref:glutathione ABC transporter substrate-binding protein GsiB n=1 Tax=Verminephrobacter aporrectodeae TaxID=1110389 RepID=UPI0022442722|nr:glutathione ABC transporter substrate-binding protein GsiB [Verminephrobacter aporrectodeae]MCW8166080.1 glutathione ABC transporter substrate-binding protein GsiB [Verminephrobacter aporrectodeae subsp. tuberculatae]MCW8170721.1 glutathione ABC transporter substrate-binding protein GsiB [Verminephrobacter aporrectodeae subsp. tuberculatae]